MSLRAVDRPDPPMHDLPEREAVAPPRRDAARPARDPAREASPGPSRPAAPARPRAPAPVRDVAGLAVADEVRAGARPWWFDAPKVLMACAAVAMAPLNLVVRLAEAAVALALLAVLALGVGWHQGYVTDKDVVAALKPVGQRVLAMVQSAADGR